MASYPPDTVPADGTRDVTVDLNSWLGSAPAGGSLSLPPDGRYRVDGTLQVVDRDVTLDAAGATIFTDDDGRRSVTPRERAHVRTVGGKVTVRNLHVRGPYPKAVYVKALEAQHGFDVRGTDVTLEGCSAANVYGDTLYLGPDVRRLTVPTSGVVRSFSGFASGRHSVSPTCTVDVTLDACTFSHAGRSIIDIEPAASSWSTRRLTVKGGFYGQSPLGWLAVSGLGEVSDLLFTDCQLVGKPMKVEVHPAADGARRSGFHFARCVSDTEWGTTGPQGLLQFHDVDDVIVAGCRAPISRNRRCALVMLDRVHRAVVIWNEAQLGAVAAAFQKGACSDVTVAGNVVAAVREDGLVVLT